MSGRDEDAAEAPKLAFSLRTSSEVRRQLEAYAASEGMTRSAAASAILEDWLRTHGWARSKGRKPRGPATTAVEAMDEAIAQHRRGRSEKGAADD